MKRNVVVLLGVVLTTLVGTNPLPWIAARQKQPPRQELPLTDQQILQKVYEKSYKTPPGFYQDTGLKDANVSLYFHQPNWFATDKDKARKIVEDFLAKPSGIKDKTIKETSTTNKYFDFRAGNIRFRVHNLNYYQPKGDKIDAGLPHGGQSKPAVIGTLKVKPLTKEAVKELAEYLWLIRFYNLGGAKVLHSEAKEAGSDLVSTLYTTQVVYGDFGLQDEITVMAETYRVNAKTGAVTHSQQVVRQLKGKKN